MQTKSFLVSRGGKVLEVVVECSAGDVWGGRAEGFFGCLVLDGRDVVPGRVPDVLDRVVVGRVRRRMDRRDALQQPAGLVEAGQRFRVVGSGVVWDDRDLAGLGFSLEQVQRADCLPGVLVLLGRVRRDCSAGRGGRASEKAWDVFCRSTDGLVRCPFGGCMRRVSASCSKRTSRLAVWTSQPASNRALTWVVAQAMRLVVAFLSRCSSNGSGRFEAQPAQAQEQPVRGVRLVFHVEQGLHGVT